MQSIGGFEQAVEVLDIGAEKWPTTSKRAEIGTVGVDAADGGTGATVVGMGRILLAETVDLLSGTIQTPCQFPPKRL